MPKAAELGVEDVVDTCSRVFGVTGNEEGDELKFLCVNPRHNESRPSCSISTVTGYWHCFSCGVGGDIAQLGVVVLRKDREEVLQLLRPATLEGVVHMVRTKLNSLTAYTRVRRTTAVTRGPYENGPLSSLRSRGFTTATLQRWGVRFVPEETLLGHKGPFTIRCSVGIPINSENGLTHAWCYRRTNSSDSWQPRYLYDTEVSHLWYGMEHHAGASDITIVEGALDAMWLDQCGYPALGLLGAGMSTGKRQTVGSKIKRLQRYKSVTLLGDRDAAGLAWVRSVGEILGSSMPVSVATYARSSEAHDPQELAPPDLEAMMERTVPWTRWKMRQPSRSA